MEQEQEEHLIHGVRILLGARILPGTIFLTARLPAPSGFACKMYIHSHTTLIVIKKVVPHRILVENTLIKMFFICSIHHTTPQVLVCGFIVVLICIQNQFEDQINEKMGFCVISLSIAVIAVEFDKFLSVQAKEIRNKGKSEQKADTETSQKVSKDQHFAFIRVDQTLSECEKKAFPQRT